MIFSSRNLLVSTLACGAVSAIIIACGADESKFDDGTGPTPSFGEAGFGGEGGGDQSDEIYKNDPPPPWCGPASGDPLPTIGGTPECPDDKNKPGCGCAKIGEQAPCWTGFRRHRNLGVCKDGVATCKARNETENVWGPCEGQVLPKPGGTGVEACACFSAGEWNIANTSPCLREGGGAYWAHSTVLAGGKSTYCTQNETVPAGTAPPGVWSTNTLKVDCAGKFKLCYKIRVGDYHNPKPTDCTLGEVCTNADYVEANVVQTLPDLSTWAGADPACAKKWEVETPEDTSPGYGEMIVKGETVRCDKVDDGNGQDYTFHRVQYCPRICRPSSANYNPEHPKCKECQLAGKGDF